MELGTVTRRIGGLRGALRRLCLLHGSLRLLFAASALLLLSFGLDYLLKLPLGVRHASFAVAILALAAVAGRWLVAPLTARISDEDLALAAESRLPELRDRLISALQFRRQIEDPENAESPAMMRAVIAEASGLAEALRAGQILAKRSLLGPALPALGAVLLLLVLFVAAPVTASVWARRNLLLEDLPWPRATTMVVLGFPESGEVVVTRGQTLKIEARAEGRVPDGAEIHVAPLSGDEGRASSRRMFQSEERRDRFEFEFRQVADSFTFWVDGGDDTDGEPVYTVRALVPPSIEQVQARCVFPAYTGLPPETFREADLELPADTKVALTLRANMPLAAAEIAVEDRPATPLALSADGREATTELVADRTIRYSVRFTGADGQRNLPGSADFRIRAVPDRKPQVRVLYPATRPWHTAKALVPFKVLATDNYGVSRVSLFLRRGDQEEFVERRFRPEELSPAGPAAEIVAYAALEAAALLPAGAPPLQPGDEIAFYAEAEDNNGNVDRTDRYRIEIVAEEELTRRLSQQQAALRQDLLKTRREEQEPAAGDVERLLEFVTRDGTLSAQDREGFREILVRQSTVTRQMDRLVTSVGEVLNSYVYNRVTNPPATERILGLFDDFLRKDHADLGTVFKREVYRLLVADYREGAVRDQQTLAVLIEILEISMKVAERTSPEAARLLTGLSRNEPEASLREDLGRTRDLQADILADFRLLDVKMQQWETYAEIIEIVRDILNTEQKIRAGAESLNR